MIQQYLQSSSAGAQQLLERVGKPKKTSTTVKDVSHSSFTGQLAEVFLHLSMIPYFG
jgi:hypothetical protein